MVLEILRRVQLPTFATPMVNAIFTAALRDKRHQAVAICEIKDNFTSTGVSKAL